MEVGLEMGVFGGALLGNTHGVCGFDHCESTSGGADRVSHEGCECVSSVSDDR